MWKRNFFKPTPKIELDRLKTIATERLTEAKIEAAEASAFLEKNHFRERYILSIKGEK